MILYEWNNYWYFIFFVAILVVLAFGVYQKIRKEKKKILWTKNWNYPKVFSLQSLKIILTILGISLLLFAVWRPQWGQEKQDTVRKGLDVVFAVDVSKSMDALDFSKGQNLISRLDATKYLVKSFTKTRPTDRIGLVEFAGESFVASPLTLDHAVFENFLQNISHQDLAKQGTNLAEALEISKARLEIKNDTKRSKIIILFSDGDQTTNTEIENIAKSIKDKGIVIYTIGIGSQKGSPIPDGQDGWGRIRYKKYHSKTVLAKLNPEPLKQIAKITGGKYFHAEKFQDLKPLEAQLNALPQKILHDKVLNPHSEKYWYFNLFGLIFFVLGLILPKRLGIKIKKKKYEKV